MRGLFLCFMGTVAAFTAQGCQREPFDVAPGNPRSGSTVEISYDPSRTLIGETDSLEAFAYVFGQGKFQKVELEPRQKGRGYAMAYAAPDTVSGLLVWFKGNGLADMNERRGYVIPLRATDGGVRRGFSAELAQMYADIDPFLGIEMHIDTLKTWFRSGLRADPGLKGPLMGAVISPFWTAGSDSVMIAFRDSLLQSFFTENRLETYSTAALSLLGRRMDQKGDSTKAQVVETVVRARNPKAELFSSRRIGNRPPRTAPVAQRMAFLDSLMTDFPDQTAFGSFQLLEIAAELGRRESTDSLLAVVDRHPSLMNASVYNSVLNALRGAGEKDLALEYSERYIEMAKNKASAGPGKDPVFRNGTLKEQEKELRLGVSMAYYKKAQAMAAFGDSTGAYQLLETVFDETPELPTSVNELYAVLAHDLGHSVQVLDRVGGFVARSASTARIDSLLPSLYRAVKGGEAGFPEYRQSLQDQALAAMREELKGKQTDAPAPDFELLDTKGQKVRLTDYKGKVVVLDFWATWCGPCIQSFPGMQKLMQELASENVHFLYVHTDENVPDRTKTARDFMEGRGYSEFHTVIDEAESAKRDYMVKGLPTRVVIDTDGRIRFKVLGHNPNLAQSMLSMKTMISIAGSSPSSHELARK